MLLGDTLITKDMATPQEVARCVEHQRHKGGRLGDAMVTLGIITQEQLNMVLYEPPASPKTIEGTGLEQIILLQLLAKGMYIENLERASQFADEMKLPTSIISSLIKEMTDRKMISITGSSGGALTGMCYALTIAGQKLAKDAMEINQYFGPAPVPLAHFEDRVLRQRITNERISADDIAKSFADIIVPDDFIKRLGPGINSGASILIYGPAGNGKTTVAEKVANIFANRIYIPYCIEVDGAIIKLHDPAIHKAFPEEDAAPNERRTLLRNPIDQRWVPCQRPVVITGGELTMEMLDLKFNEIAKFYEAPLHVKALNGTFIIDDFGRQIISPEDLLNRWIVPLQSRVDYLRLHSGKTFQIPFDELVIFSTNLSPNDLMDPAFLRRIPYKLETVNPSRETFIAIFRAVAKGAALELTDDILQFVLTEIVDTFKKDLACYQPKFIVDQVISACKYEGTSPAFSREIVADALDNLYVRDSQYVG